MSLTVAFKGTNVILGLYKKCENEFESPTPDNKVKKTLTGTLRKGENAST